MYKRRARILFLDPGDGHRAWLARVLAEQLAADWIDPAAAALAPGPLDPGVGLLLGEPGPAPVPAWSGLAGKDWDLVVALGEGADWDVHLAGVRYKLWQLEGCPFSLDGEGALESCREVLQAGVLGLLGGFRMKSREDGPSEDRGE